MKNIILACMAGMSTSLLVSKMKKAAEEAGNDVHIEAMPFDALDAYEGPVDILLLGPQISYVLEEAKEKYEPKGIKVASINMMDYGMMNGKKVLEEALRMMA